MEPLISSVGISEALREGWLYTGDIGELDNDGYIYIPDRKKNIAIVGGYNVYPREIDEVLFLHPEVKDAASAGVPDPCYGETMRATVVLKPGAQATSGDLIAHCAANLARYKVPAKISIVDSLPRTSVGKIDRTALKDAPAAQLGRLIDRWNASVIMAEEELRKRIEDFLDRHHIVSLATVGPQGVHAANLFYARDGLTLIWMSDTDTRHSREIETRADVAATISAASLDYSSIQGLQIHGLAQRTSREDRVRLLSLLGAKFPFLLQMRKAPEALQAAYQRAEIYQLQPADIVLIDNTRGFGHKETLAL